MAEFSCRPRQVDGDGAAKRRRLRRLRSWWRHEQQTVAAVLATYQHHSAPRGPRTARTGGGARDELHGYAPEDAPPRGSRPPCLGEPRGPHARVQRRTVQQVVDTVPLVPLLDVPVPQVVDTVLEFFRALDKPVDELVIAVPKISTDRVSQRLVERRLPQMVEQLVEVPTVVSYSSLLQREAEYEAHMQELDHRVHADLPLTPAESRAWRKWAGHFPVPTRRKKKRKKKKLPRAPRPRCQRPCVHQRQVPAVWSSLVMQRQVPTVHSFILPVQFLDTVFDMPVVVLRQVPGLMVQETVVRPQLPSIVGRRHSLRSAVADPHGPDCSADHRDFSVAVRSQVVDALAVQVVRSHRLYISVYSAMLGSTVDTKFTEIFTFFLREKVDYGS